MMTPEAKAKELVELYDSRYTEIKSLIESERDEMLDGGYVPADFVNKMFDDLLVEIVKLEKASTP